MDQPHPTLDEWRALYDAALRVRDLEPWESMEEIDIFGVQDPEGGGTGFVSVMGSLGEHLAVSIALGASGLHRFLQFASSEEPSPEALLDIPMLQASFEDRNELTGQDRKVINDLGLKVRGRQAWPMFRAFRPGFLPWYLEGWETRFLTHALEQAIDVALRLKADRAILPPANGNRFLVRTCQQLDGSLRWEDRIVSVPLPEPQPVRIEIDGRVIEGLKRLPRSKEIVEMDLVTVPTNIYEPGQRPYRPKALLVVDRDTDLLIGAEMLSPEPTQEATWAKIPNVALQQLLQAGIMPKQISVRSFVLQELLGAVAEYGAFEVKRVNDLRALDRVAKFLFDRFGPF